MKQLIITLLGIYGGLLAAQDPHFSNPEFAPQYQNPAQTGVFVGQHRFAALWRHQWQAVPVPYQSLVAGWDAPVAAQKIRNGILGVGFQVLWDKAGDARIGRLVVSASVAYTQRIGKKQSIGLGFQTGMGQRRFDPQALTFDNQWNGDSHDPTLPTGEAFGRTAFFYPDLATGLLWRLAVSRRMHVSAGAALAHPHQPAQWFIEGGGPRLPLRWSLHTAASAPLGERWDALLQAQFMVQGPYRETLLGLGTKYHLSIQKGREAAVSFGAKYRWADAAVFYFGLDYQNWTAIISYDYNISAFRNATNGAGGPELGLIYRVVSATETGLEQEFRKGKVCPVF